MNAAIVVVLLLNVPLTGEHVLPGSVTSLYVPHNVVSGRGANCRLGSGSHDMVAVGENRPQTWGREALVNGHRMAMIFQHGRMQKPFCLPFPRVPLR